MKKQPVRPVLGCAELSQYTTMSRNVTVLQNENGEYDSTPTYLFDHVELYKDNPHEAALTWFVDAHYGLGLHFGIHSLMGRGHDVMRREAMKPEAYKQLLQSFRADHFDAVDLVEFAIANGMRYVDFTVRGADGFCLYNSAVCEFNCAASPAKRDLLAELASVCEYHGIGLCLTYSHGVDWTHPNSPESLAEAKEGISGYLDYAAEQLRELLTQYGPIAAVCLEGIEHLGRPGYDKAVCDDLYRMIRHFQPQTLISYQGGATGDEDFFYMEDESSREAKPDKIAQLRENMTPGRFSYDPSLAGRHLKEQHIMDRLRDADRQRANLLVSTCLMPDGSLDLEDMNTLLSVGQYIEKHGFPR